MIDDQKDKMKTAAQKVARYASADAEGFPFRKVTSSIIALSGVFLLIAHMDHDHETGWAPWVLLFIGCSDLGIQSAGIIAERFLK